MKFLFILRSDVGHDVKIRSKRHDSDTTFKKLPVFKAPLEGSAEPYKALKGPYKALKVPDKPLEGPYKALKGPYKALKEPYKAL